MITRSADHRYTFERVEYPGVTASLRVIDKSDALMIWASRKTAEAAIGLIDVLPQMMGQIGPEGVVKALSARSAWTRDEAAGIGTEIHAMADRLHRGELLPPVSIGIRTRVEHYAAWWAACGWKLRATEAMVVNPRVGYGGTLDLLAYDPEGRTVLADIKTGGVYREAILQLAAYGDAMWIDIGNEGVYVMPTIDRYVVLQVKVDGIREIEVNVGDAERAAFKAALTLSAWRESVKGRL